MPINEAAGRSRNHLTKAQKQEQEAAIYGLAPQKVDMDTQQFSPEEIERMRAILAQHDSHEGQRGGPKEFDLNNPPKQPYRFKEFPKVLYRHKDREHCTVHSAKEEKAAIAKGFESEPFPPEHQVYRDEPDPADEAEIARLDKLARQKPKPQPADAQ